MAKTNTHVTYSDLTNADRRGLGHTVTQQRLKAGTRLYKFTEFGVFGGHGITAWWAFVEPFNSGSLRDPGLSGHIHAAKAANMPMIAYARRVFAVMFEWNRLSAPALGLARVQHITLVEPANAFISQGAAMPAYSSVNPSDSALDHARTARYEQSLSAAQKRDTERMWQQKSERAVGMSLLPGGAVQVCLKNLQTKHISIGAIQLIG